ncbi:MAG: hypothetical protein HZB35_07975 [Nitrospirae bacterium]|nr:hypothetical protein [Nitrospirota bacterium]
MKRGLLICRIFELLALSVWVGGLIVIIAAVIPAVFNSFGMEPGGRFLTNVFDGYNQLVVGAIVMLLGAIGFRIHAKGELIASTPGPLRTELILLGLMVIIAILIIGLLGPKSVTLQELAFATKGEAERKEAYSAFFRIHSIVRGLYLVNLGLGIALLVVKVKAWGEPRRDPA